VQAHCKKNWWLLDSLHIKRHGLFQSQFNNQKVFSQFIFFKRQNNINKFCINYFIPNCFNF